MKQGIYFNLPYQEYRDARGLSYSALKDLLISPLKYWDNHINPDKPEYSDSDAKMFGRAYHKFILENDNFFDDFALYPEDAPKKPTKAQINAKKPSDAALESMAYWQNFNSANEGKDIIKQDSMDTLIKARDMLLNYPDITDSLKDGYAEVSFFIEYQGLMLKGRFDFISAKETIDLKTFSNSLYKNIDKVTRDGIVYNRYNLQWFMYNNLRVQAVKLLRQGKLHVEGDVSEQFLKDFAANDKPSYSLVFQESARPFEARKIELAKACSLGGTPNVYWQESKRTFEDIITKYKYNKEKFGKEPWVGDFYNQELQDEEVPNIIYQNQ